MIWLPNSEKYKNSNDCGVMVTFVFYIDPDM